MMTTTEHFKYWEDELYIPGGAITHHGTDGLWDLTDIASMVASLEVLSYWDVYFTE